MTGSSDVETDQPQCDHLSAEWKAEYQMNVEFAESVRRSTIEECAEQLDFAGMTYSASLVRKLAASPLSQGDRTAAPRVEASVEPEGKTP